MLAHVLVNYMLIAMYRLYAVDLNTDRHPCCVSENTIFSHFWSLQQINYNIMFEGM